MSSKHLPQRGDVIAGKFEVEGTLGVGGMGVVVAARDIALRRRVAIKLLAPHVAELPEAAGRFLREARAVVALQSPHVARVIDMGETSFGAPFLVMELLTGNDFSKVLKQRGALPVPEAIDYVLQAGDAIAEAHALGIVHRDLKPANLFLTARAGGAPLVKVLDFGLSKVISRGDDDLDGSLTTTGAIVGSPFYMAPEQVRCHPDIDGRADIWSMGVILYEMLTGQKPFEGPTLPAVAAKIVADTPAPMRSRHPEIPEAVERAVMSCLAKSPGDRPPTVAALAEALAPFAPPASRGLIADLAGPLAASGQASTSSATSAVAPPPSLPLPRSDTRPTSIEDASTVERPPPEAALHNTARSSAWGASNAASTPPARWPIAWLAVAAMVPFSALVWALWPTAHPMTTTPQAAPSPTSSAPTPATSTASPNPSSSHSPSHSPDPPAPAPIEPAAQASAESPPPPPAPQKPKPVKARKRDPFANPN